MKRKKRSPRMSAKKALDDVFSKWVRLSNADKNGYCTCCTCHNRFHWKEIQCGHYITRNHMATRWLKENTAPQCVGCNCFGGGKPAKFAIYIMRKYGHEQLEKLDQAASRVTKFHTYDLQAMIKVYERELEKLQKEAL